MKQKDKLRELAIAARNIVKKYATMPHSGGDLGGFCGDWTYIFCKLAKANGIKVKAVSGSVLQEDYPEGHYWAETPTYFCDGTGNQFRKNDTDPFPAVQVRPKKNRPGKYIYVKSVPVSGTIFFGDKDFIDKEIKNYLGNK